VVTELTERKPAVRGFVAPGFEGVRDAFADNFASRGDTGASVCVYADGAEVVHLWGGDARPGTPWQQDTLVCGMSTVKPVLATAVAVLADRGALDVDAPIADVWPEFVAAGKQDVTTAHVLTHTAGLPFFPGQEDIVSFDDPSTFARLKEIAAGLAAAPPQTPPGSTIASHSITVGWLLAEVVRRAGGVGIDELVRTAIADPLGVECWIGLPPSEQGRVAEMETDPAYDSDALHDFINPQTPAGRALFLGPQRRLGSALRMATNDPAYRETVNPAAGAFVTARTLARVYAMLAGGGELEGTRVLSRERVREFTTVRAEGTDALFFVQLRTSLGFLHPSPSTRYGPAAPSAFGFPGQGGQLAFADPERGLAFSYMPGRIVFLDGQDPRADALVEAAYAASGTDQEST
jgi:CubicO group peptidase (beta-lactamase class C family)